MKPRRITQAVALAACTAGIIVFAGLQLVSMRVRADDAMAQVSAHDRSSAHSHLDVPEHRTLQRPQRCDRGRISVAEEQLPIGGSSANQKRCSRSPAYSALLT